MSALEALLVEGTNKPSPAPSPNSTDHVRTTFMTAHHLRIGISREKNPDATVNVARRSIRERILSFLFGPLREITLVVPGRRVDEIAISRRADPDYLMALAEAIQNHPAGTGDDGSVGGEGA